jgi:pimeloyl-ACP methyl ester carboxylesterase
MLALLPQGAPVATRRRVERETCDNDPRAAIALFETLRAYDQAAALRAAGVPVWAINSAAFPTSVEHNRKHAPSFEAVLMEGVGHYPQIERPAEFQAHLRRIVKAVSASR